VESVTNVSGFVGTKDGFADNIGGEFVEVIEALRSNAATNTRGNSFAKVTNKIRNCE